MICIFRFTGWSCCLCPVPYRNHSEMMDKNGLSHHEEWKFQFLKVIHLPCKQETQACSWEEKGKQKIVSYTTIASIKAWERSLKTEVKAISLSFLMSPHMFHITWNSHETPMNIFIDCELLLTLALIWLLFIDNQCNVGRIFRYIRKNCSISYRFKLISARKVSWRTCFGRR